MIEKISQCIYGVCFEDLKEEFNKWINHSCETSELVSKALEIIKNQQNVYGTTLQNRLIGTDRAILLRIS